MKNSRQKDGKFCDRSKESVSLVDHLETKLKLLKRTFHLHHKTFHHILKYVSVEGAIVSLNKIQISKYVKLKKFLHIFPRQRKKYKYP